MFEILLDWPKLLPLLSLYNTIPYSDNILCVCKLSAPFSWGPRGQTQCLVRLITCSVFSTEITLWLGPSKCLNESCGTLHNILFLLKLKVKDLVFDCGSFFLWSKVQRKRICIGLAKNFVRLMNMRFNKILGENEKCLIFT